MLCLVIVKLVARGAVGQVAAGVSLVVTVVASLVVVGVVRLIEVTAAAEGRVSDLQEFLVFEVASLFQPGKKGGKSDLAHE